MVAPNVPEEPSWAAATFVWNVVYGLVGMAVTALGLTWKRALEKGGEEAEIAEWRKGVDARFAAIESRKERQDLKLEQMSERLAQTPTRTELVAMMDRLDQKLEGIRTDLHRG